MHRITTPTPFKLDHANVYLFQGDKPTIIDCGLGSSRSYEALHAGLRDAKQDPAELQLYITHGHVDHAGNAGRLRADYGTPLLCPGVESPFVETFRRDSTRRNDEFAEALLLHGMPGDVVKVMRHDSDAIDRFLDDVPITTKITDGERVQFGDEYATAYIAPGHTPGSTIYELENEVITGDTLLERISSNALELREDDYGMYHLYIQAVESMRKFNGCTALPGHHDPFTISDELIDQHIHWHESRRDKIKVKLTSKKTAFHLMADIFPGLTEHGQWFMAMADLVGHLHALEIDGQIKRNEVNGVRWFEA